MEARSSPTRAYVQPERLLLSGLGRWLAPIAALLCLAVASLFAARRILLGEWQRALEGGELLLLAILMVGSLCGGRIAWRRWSASRGDRWRALSHHATFSVAAVILAVAVTSSESPLAAVVLLWAALSIEETWFWNSVFARGPAAAQFRGHIPNASSSDHRPASSVVIREAPTAPLDEPPCAAPMDRTDAGELREEELEEAETEFPAGYLQQMSRFRDHDGGEVIHGLLRAEFTAGQRVHHLHVAFCPPLPASPELSFEQVDGAEASVSAGQVESYGARLDLRLARPAQEGESAVVEFYARVGDA